MADKDKTKNQGMTERKTLPRWYRLPAVVFIVGLFSILLLLWGESIRVRQNQSAMMMETIDHILIQTSVAHLRLEEYLSGDTSINVEETLAMLDQAVVLSDSLLVGGRTERGVLFQPLKEPRMRKLAVALKSLLMEFRTLALESVKEGKRAGYGTILGRRFHELYENIVTKNNELESIFEKNSIRVQSRLNRSFWGALFFLALFTIVSAITLGRHEKRRMRATEDLERMFNLSDYMVCIADIRTAQFLKISPAFEQTLGHTSEELLAKPFIDFIHPEDKDKTIAVIEEKLRKGIEVFAFENRYRCKDGSYKWFAWTARPVVEEGVTFAIAYDVTERKKAEEGLLRLNRELEGRVAERTRELREANEQVLRTEKLATLGQLASSVGHEIRNPLAVIGNAVYILKKKLGDKDEKVNKYLDILKQAVLRSNKIITDLLDFSRDRPPALAAADLNRLVTNALADIRFPKNVIVKTRLHEDMAEVLLDAGQIEQVIQNLVTNALQAMPEGGVLEIETGVRGEFAELVFKDSGDGIPEDKLKKVFEPLFTTRARGTGLGLAIVEGIIERHNGTIEVKSKAGEGTAFTVSLPLTVE